MARKPQPQSPAQKASALYHVVYADETFEDAAEKIWAILRMAQERTPGAPRWLFLDIEGHRNEAGGFDADMYELQSNFALTTLMPYLSRFECPLLRNHGAAVNDNQRDDIPEALTIRPRVPD
jgi:hypothetical protein